VSGARAMNYAVFYRNTLLDETDSFVPSARRTRGDRYLGRSNMSGNDRY
jgi:hypothetical protein